MFLVARGEVGGRKFDCGLDTGFTFTSARRELARRWLRAGQALTITPETRAEAEGEDPRETSTAIRLNRLALGGVEVQNLRAEVEDLRVGGRGSSAYARIPVPDLLLGSDFLHRHQALLHVAGRCLYLYTGPTDPAAVETRRTALARGLERSGIAEIKMRQAPGLAVLVPLQVNQQEGHVLVDTGAAVTTLHSTFATQAGLTPRLLESRFLGVGGRSSWLGLADVTTLALGPARSTKFPVGIVDLKPWLPENAATSEPETVGLLGPDILTRTHALLDYGACRLFLKPGPFTAK